MLVLLWSLLVFMVYKVATVETEYQEYDPFEILQLDPVSTRVYCAIFGVEQQVTCTVFQGKGGCQCA